MKARRLPASEKARALAAFSSAAICLDPFNFEPREAAKARLVSIGPFYLRRHEFEGVAQAAPTQHALLTNLNADGSLFEDVVWEVRLTEYPYEELKQDPSWNGIGSSVVAAVDGAWTVVISDEGFGVVSGDWEFVSRVQAGLPSHGGDLGELVDRLVVGRSEPDAQVIDLVARLYDDAVAHEMAARVNR